ncbi:glutamyl-tRNA reductase [Haloferax mediterranei ATCC 33500]|uniref:Glutamyl-tRNA reductase n=1 Tax=Haloferax mediterranei (strain ATCC 33500 / DSM 1411 / JCM 8866 / NBRC 14739 / NCIMB 2177 / R-4) TaxID=523841 RepID=I3R6Z8_HALMT|nr:glutamyl-tRNA reductase [Haloferax mediterranei]AFK20008.1 glutamyl-tRNA reductase [Haloferax mediterranei ATCC 33500]AHZ23386.1 glutamyl-tRNA reductase [Haloferax mediterranei ATCC 33500]ELZ99555.1 glutamyl-tRNA reductase [Haloferax mediterranei ATCC 33500]MDX5987240.1 glutamyl-tRNA reductase [Haloferax mediterranei ATCC 33500]QCQ73762.1 glutamyl-tRNA reductase [Haloferax mediterranei ATCC 33500]
MRNAGVISGVSVAHDRATVREIESASSDDVQTVVKRLLACEGVSEAFSLQTCNRAEAYVVTDDATDGRRALDDFAPDVRDGSVRHMDHEESLRHLMRVAAGLESLVLGEDQILGQVKSSIETARELGAIGPMLEDALLKAVHVGERARDETAINEGAVSLGSAAVRLARAELDEPICASTALVIGAGEMGTLATKALASVNVGELVVANRTVSHAVHLAREVPGVTTAAGLDDISDLLGEADLVITATSSPDYVVDATHLSGAETTILIDIAQPRDVDPAADELDGISVRDIDDLETVTDRTAERRERASRAVEAMIDEEFDRLLAAYKRKRADEAISSMYEAAEHVKRREVSTALSKLEAQGDLTDEQRETVESLADALIGQLLAAPTKSLRDAAGDDDWTTIQTAMRLFDPGFGDLPGPNAADSSTPRVDIPDDHPIEMDRDVSEKEVSRRMLEQLSND